MSTCETNVVEQTTECTEGTCCREQAVRELAYQKWQQAGEPGGDGVNFWLDAETELASEWADALTSGDYVEAEVTEE